MKSRAAAAFIFALANPWAFSQLTIENPQQQQVPEVQARILLQMSFQAVAKELRPEQKTDTDFPLRLVIGEDDERFGVDAKTGIPTLFLREWDPVKFTTVAVRFAIQKSVRPERQEEMISEIVRRSKAVAPVSAAQLRGSAEFAPATHPPTIDCVKGIYDAALSGKPCSAMPGNHSGPVR